MQKSSIPTCTVGNYSVAASWGNPDAATAGSYDRYVAAAPTLTLKGKKEGLSERG
jgi:hypothetical protein